MSGPGWDVYTWAKQTSKEGEAAVGSGQYPRARYTAPARELADIAWTMNGKTSDPGHAYYTSQLASDPRFNQFPR